MRKPKSSNRSMFDKVMNALPRPALDQLCKTHGATNPGYMLRPDAEQFLRSCSRNHAARDLALVVSRLLNMEAFATDRTVQS